MGEVYEAWVPGDLREGEDTVVCLTFGRACVQQVRLLSAAQYHRSQDDTRLHDYAFRTELVETQTRGVAQACNGAVRLYIWVFPKMRVAPRDYNMCPKMLQVLEPPFIIIILGTPRYWKLPFRLVRRPTPLGEHGGYGARARGKAGSVTNRYSFNLGHYRSRIRSKISVPLGYSDYFRKRIC